tara:strand:+ start:174 stop:593 length:420 start_codon:yes stop_codon:yes gene_type:complete
MGNNLSINKINFEDMKHIQKNENSIIINTMEPHNQDCLIEGTISIKNEENILNNLITKGNIEEKIVIYGENSCDNKLIKKYNQLIKIGFINVYIYTGGLFEWLLLQDIYGNDYFKTTTVENDFLKYKGIQKFNIKLLCN